MGGLISLLRDIKTIYKDLKVTLKLTARIVLKVHGIVDDVEHTVQELKAAVKGLSAKISPENGTGEVAFDALVENVESKASLLKTSLIEATSQVFNEDLLKNTQQKWDKVVEYSRLSSEALANIVASSSFYISGGQDESNAEQESVIEKPNISLSDVKESDEENEECNADGNLALVPVFNDPPSTSSDEEDDVRDFEILPAFDIMDSFWKCDVGCLNIDCVDFQQRPTRKQRNGEVNAQLKKKKTKKRNGKSKLSKKTGISGTSSGHTPVKYHHNKQNRPRENHENVALEVIFLVALLVEGATMSNSNLFARERPWNKCKYGSYSRAAEIIELDD